MTSYSATSASASSQKYGLLAVTYQIQIAKLELATDTNSAVVAFPIYKNVGASMSGGTAITPVPLRDGSQAAQSRAAEGATVTGTSSLLAEVSSTSSAVGAWNITTYTFPYDLILNPGNALYLTMSAINAFVRVFFDELHLARSN